MKTITFHCQTITPMFLAGADGQTPELRPPSIKGALRFWWRAMNAGNYRTIAALKEVESKIFGGTDEEAGRSKVVIEIRKKNFETRKLDFNCNNTVEVKTPKGTFKVPVLKYIAYGAEKRKSITGCFDLKIDYDEKYENDLKQSLSALNQFGGLGSKVRNGFGSVQLSRKGTGFDLEKIDVEGFKNIKTEFTGFNKDALFKEIASGDNALDVLEQMGKTYCEAKQDTEKTNLIANSKINWLKLERYPKTYFFSVKKRGKEFVGQVLFLPVLLKKHQNDSKTDMQYQKQHSEFQNILLK